MKGLFNETFKVNNNIICFQNFFMQVYYVKKKNFVLVFAIKNYVYAVILNTFW